MRHEYSRMKGKLSLGNIWQPRDSGRRKDGATGPPPCGKPWRHMLYICYTYAYTWKLSLTRSHPKWQHQSIFNIDIHWSLSILKQSTVRFWILKPAPPHLDLDTSAFNASHGFTWHKAPEFVDPEPLPAGPKSSGPVPEACPGESPLGPPATRHGAAAYVVDASTLVCGMWICWKLSKLKSKS